MGRHGSHRPARGPHEEGPRRPEAPAKMRRPDRPERLDPIEVAKIAEHVRKAVELAGLDVVLVRIFPDRRVRVMIDVLDGGVVKIADCERASRAAEAGLVVAEVDPGTFELDVESPGADRPLTRDVDFARFKEQQVTVTLKEDRDGRRNFTGKLLGHEKGDVRVHVLDEPEPETFLAAAIKEVRLHPDLKMKPRE